MSLNSDSECELSLFPKGISTNYRKASKACEGIDEIVEHIAKLHDEGQQWRSRFLELKKDVFSKHMTGTNCGKKKMFFQWWRKWQSERKAERDFKVEIVEEERLQRELKSALEKQIHQHEVALRQIKYCHRREINDLDRQVAQREAELEALRTERSRITKRAEKHTNVLLKISRQLKHVGSDGPTPPPGKWSLPVPESLAGVAPPALKAGETPACGNFEWLMIRLHDVLAKIDDRYQPRGGWSMNPYYTVQNEKSQDAPGSSEEEAAEEEESQEE